MRPPLTTLSVRTILCLGTLYLGVLSLGALPGLSTEAMALPMSPVWQWPLSGPREIIAPFEPHSEFGPGHRGVDLPASEGSPVYAVADGRVTFAGYVAGRHVITISHDRSGIRSTLEPVHAVVDVGEAISRGDVIGLVGAGGHCSRSCLHLGMRRGERYVNPVAVLRGFALLKPSGPRVRLIEGGSKALHGDVRVPLRGGESGVSQHLLHGTEIGTPFQHMRGSGVPHPVRSNVRHARR